MKNSVYLQNRLKDVLICDKKEVSDKMRGMITTDITRALEAYMFLRPNSTFINFNLDSNGNYIINITATIERLKEIGFFR